MKWTLFLCVFVSAAAVSCSRDEMRAPRYDAHECPFCTTHKGVCSYCNGTKKCTFCDGKGNRNTVVPSMPGMDIKGSSYQEKCHFCGGGGTCRHCSGKGTCWVCDGDGRIDSWNFQEKAANVGGGER